MKRRALFWLALPFFLTAIGGFDLSRHSVPLNEIHDGGPPKDGIPALTDPAFIPADEASFLRPHDRVLALELNGEAKAYPIRILNWHELVNDRVGGRNVLISYCPLCGTGMAFEADREGERSLFGVSGKLYNSDVLFYDHRTESLWSQIKKEAVTGPLTGQKLRQLPLMHTSWKDWHSRHPRTQVLSLQTGYRRNYGRNPYVGYDQSQEIYFPVAHEDRRLERKDWVLGVVVDGRAKAYPFKELQKTTGSVIDRLGAQTIRIVYNADSQSAEVRDEDGRLVPSVQAFWFAWAAFYPDTELFHA